MPCSFNLITAHFNDSLDGLALKAQDKIADLRRDVAMINRARSPFKVEVTVWVQEPCHEIGMRRWRTDSVAEFGRITNAQSLDILIDKAAAKFRKKFPQHTEGAAFQIELFPLIPDSCAVPYEVGKKLNRKVAGFALRYHDPTPTYA